MIAISVIIPVYNRANIIKKTVKDTLKQDITNIEVICVDDGSTDNSLIMLQSLSNQDHRVRVFHQKNAGAGSARNLGIKEAKGEYLFFLDSDDSIMSYDVLRKMYETARNNNADICGGRLFVETEDGIKVEKSTDLETEGFVLFRDYQNDYFFTRFLYRTEALKKYGIFFPVLYSYEDPVFLLSTMIKLKQFYQMDIDTYKYIKKDRKKSEEAKSIKEIKELLKGINHNLIVSSKYNFEKLHFDIYNRVEYDVCPEIEKQFENIDDSLLYQLMICNANLNLKMIRTYCNLKDNYLLPPLDYLLNASINYKKMTKNPILFFIRKITNLFKKG